MFFIHAKLINTFHVAATLNDDEKTVKYPESWKIQMLGNVALKDGDTKSDLITIGVPKDIHDELLPYGDTEVKIPIGVFSGKGSSTITYFWPKGSRIPPQNQAD